MTWIAPVRHPTGWAVQPLNLDTYAGLAGVALLLAGYLREAAAGRADDVSGLPALLNATIATIATIEDELARSTIPGIRHRPPPPGAYMGLGSQIWAWLTLHRLGAVGPNALTRARALAQQLPDAIAASEETELLAWHSPRDHPAAAPGRRHRRKSMAWPSQHRRRPPDRGSPLEGHRSLLALPALSGGPGRVLPRRHRNRMVPGPAGPGYPRTQIHRHSPGRFHLRRRALRPRHRRLDRPAPNPTANLHRLVQRRHRRWPSRCRPQRARLAHPARPHRPGCRRSPPQRPRLEPHPMPRQPRKLGTTRHHSSRKPHSGRPGPCPAHRPDHHQHRTARPHHRVRQQHAYPRAAGRHQRHRLPAPAPALRLRPALSADPPSLTTAASRAEGRSSASGAASPDSGLSAPDA